MWGSALSYHKLDGLIRESTLAVWGTIVRACDPSLLRYSVRAGNAELNFNEPVKIIQNYVYIKYEKFNVEKISNFVSNIGYTMFNWLQARMIIKYTFDCKIAVIVSWMHPATCRLRVGFKALNVPNNCPQCSQQLPSMFPTTALNVPNNCPQFSLQFRWTLVVACVIELEVVPL